MGRKKNLPDLHERSGVIPRDTLQLIYSGSRKIKAQLHGVVFLGLDHGRSSVVVQLGRLEVDPGDNTAALLDERHVDTNVLGSYISDN